MKYFIYYFLFTLSFLFTSANACTDFRIIGKDGTIIIARSMEFAMDMQSNLRNSNRDRQFTTMGPQNKAGLTWKATYGYLFLDGLQQDFAIDGMNEKGLSFEYLYLPGETVYQTVPSGKENMALPYYALGDWILSNFKNIDEVRLALKNIYVHQAILPNVGNVVFPVHAAVFDASGKGIVIEFTKGNMNVYDNIGVMTNSPEYSWQVTNLRNYLNLSPYNPKPVIFNGMTYSATGQGSGMIGLPGDVSPPSRFVKISLLLSSAYPVNNNLDALNLAEHVMNNVDIPAGFSRAINQGKESAETTQWVVFKDLTHKIFYYRTYNDLTMRSVSMDKVDFSANAKRFKMPLADKPFLMDMTDKFVHSS